jgi:CHAT domain-containing protein
LSADPIDRLEAWAQKAEEAWSKGDFAGALQNYARGMSERLATGDYGVKPGAQLGVADFFVLERLSDLARLFGRTEAADELLEISVNQIGAAGNRYWADLLHVKRIDLALGSGRLRMAQSLLGEMSQSIGDVTQISFTPEGLTAWERRCHWPNADGRDRATIFALLYFVMGKLLAACGQYRQAASSLRRGLAHTTERAGGGGAHRVPQELAKQAVAPLTLALATALLEKGELEGAAKYLHELTELMQEKTGPAFFVQTLELQGKLHLLAGEFGAALGCFRQVRDSCVRHGFARAAVAATLNLAQALIFLNQTLDARRHLQVARDHAQQIGDTAAVARAEWLLQLALARAESLADSVPIARTVTEQWEFGDAARQQTLSGKAYDDDDTEAQVARAFADAINPLDLPQPDNYLAFFEERVLGFHWLLGRRDFKGCAAYLAQLEKIFFYTDSALIKVRLRVLSGLLAYYMDDFRQAEKILTEAQTELRRMHLLPELWQLQRVLQWSLVKLGADEAMQEELATENARLLGIIADSLESDDRAFFLLNKWTAEEEELAALVNRLSRMKAELSLMPWYRRFRQRRHLRAQTAELLRIIDHYRDIKAERTTRGPMATPEAASGLRGQDSKDSAPPSGPSFLRRLWPYKRRHATISFLVLPDRVIVIRQSPFTLDFGVGSATRIEVRELVRQWHEIIARITQEKARGLGLRPEEAGAETGATDALFSTLTERAREIAESLSKLLQLPSVLDNLSRSTRSLTLVPDDTLHGFPFAAIIHRGRYLVERYALSFAYHSDDQAPVPRAEGGESGALLVGASLGGGDWPPLEFVPQELDNVAGWVAGRRLATQRLDDARPACAAPDKATVISALSRSSFVHLACHGIFKPDHPAHSGIVLRPARQPDVLSVQELSALDLANIRHVTLSACWSADHFILPGRWVISLPETLARSGVGSVLGCLWLVDDRVATSFMAEFYQHLNKHTRAEALRLTQLACLKNELAVPDSPDTTHPIFWAGYQLYGRADALRL